MPKARANINIYSSARFSGLIFEDEMICIPRTARYVVRNKAETAEDAESTSEHQRIQQYTIFRLNFWRRNDMYTTNCQVCGTKSSKNHELPGMWYEIKQKQQKMPKARANINQRTRVYSSTRFSSLIFEDEMICIPRTSRYVKGIKAKTAEDAESTSEHERIQQYSIFRFNF